jgi:hypothetical protein
MNRIVKILMERDEMGEDEARELFAEGQRLVHEDGEDPTDVLEDMFGLEPDYIEDLL